MAPVLAILVQEDGLLSLLKKIKKKNYLVAKNLQQTIEWN